MNPVEIIPRLYLGSEHASRSLEVLSSLKVSHIVNMASECKNHFPETFGYFNGKLKDMEDEDVRQLAYDVCKFIEKVLSQEGETSVFIHCQAGISRSVAMVLGYLIIHEKMNLKDAFFLIKNKKPNVGPNKGYMQQLCQLDLEMNGSISFHMSEYYVDTFEQYGFVKEDALDALITAEYDFDVALDILLMNLK